MMDWKSIFSRKNKQNQNHSNNFPVQGNWQHTGITQGHSHAIPAGGVLNVSAGPGGSHTHGIDMSCGNQTCEIIPDNDVCIYYDFHEKQVRRVKSKDNLYSWGGNEIMDRNSVCEAVGDILGGLIQDGGDIRLFKSMIGEKIKEVIDEFTPEGNK